MSEQLLIDTDVLIEYLRGRDKAAEYLEDLTANLSISVISIAELFAGLKGDEEERALQQFLLAFTVLPVTERVARTGGFYRRDYRPSHGTGLSGCPDRRYSRGARPEPRDFQSPSLPYDFSRSTVRSLTQECASSLARPPTSPKKTLTRAR